eukprot:6181099-Pleurochrysis_carterae.AAC.3
MPHRQPPSQCLVEAKGASASPRREARASAQSLEMPTDRTESATKRTHCAHKSCRPSPLWAWSEVRHLGVLWFVEAYCWAPEHPVELHYHWPRRYVPAKSPAFCVAAARASIVQASEHTPRTAADCGYRQVSWCPCWIRATGACPSCFDLCQLQQSR